MKALPCRDIRTINFDPSVTMREAAPNLKTLKLHFENIESTVAAICNACPQLAELHLFKMPMFPLKLDKLQVLALQRLPDNKEWNPDWITQFPTLKRFKVAGFLGNLDFLLKSNVTQLDVPMCFINPAVHLPKLTSLKLGGDISRGDSIVPISADPTITKRIIQFLAKHSENLQKLYWINNDKPAEVMNFVAEKCTNLKVIRVGDVKGQDEHFMTKKWKAFCHHRKETGNVGQRVTILTDLTIDWEYLKDANATTITKSQFLNFFDFL